MAAWIRNFTSSVCVAALTLLGAAACDYGDDVTYSPYQTPSSQCGTLTRATIDTGMGVEADEGTSLLIEYASGGLWSVRSACDTTTSNRLCSWDVIVEPLAGTITKFSASGTEAGDELGWYARNSLQFGAYTGSTSKGFSFEAQPGAIMRFDVLLDGRCGNQFIYWFGDGAVHRGAPSNPMELAPSAD